MTSNDAKVVLAQVMALFNRDMTDLEIMIWRKMISDFGDAAVIRFLIAHTERSNFAPKPAEALQMLRPGQDNPMVALEMLRSAIAKEGPYNSPVFSDPAIPGAVEALGGWAKINEEFPAPTEQFAYQNFYKRFEAVYKQAQADLMIGVKKPVQLLGLHSVGKQQAQNLLLSMDAKETSTAPTRSLEVQR